MGSGTSRSACLAGIDSTSQWRWAEADAELRRALDLNPNDAAAHQGLSEWLLCHGRVEEALAWARRARQLIGSGDPNNTIVWILVNAHRYDQAIKESRNVLAVRPDCRIYPFPYFGWALIFNHQAEEGNPRAREGGFRYGSKPRNYLYAGLGVRSRLVDGRMPFGSWRN